MTFQLSTSMMNNILDQYEAQLLTLSAGAPILRLRSGAKPANCAAAEAGGSVVIATINLNGTDFMSAASGGSKAFILPLSATASNAGTLGYYRIYANNGTTVLEQGSITVTGSGGDMTVDNTSVSSGQTINITGWTKDLSAHV